MNKTKYVQFPLYLLRGLFDNKDQVLNDIFKYGIYKFSKTITNDPHNVAKQTMYGFYRGVLTDDLLNLMQDYVNSGKIDIDEDYNGFSGSEFNPETEINQLLELFIQDDNFKDKAIEYYQIKVAYDFLGITGNYDNCIKRGQKIESQIPDKEPMPMVSKTLLFQFRDHSKTEFDLMQFACYVGVRSILGKKKYSRTNKKMILCRAFGYSSIKHLPDELPELFKKYSKRYHIDRVINFLELNWNFMTYSNNMRGIYVAAADKMTLEELAIIAETKKHSKRLDELKNRKKDAKLKAFEQLNKGQHLKK